MSISRKPKIIYIIALTIAICGMTLGFAAFSASLTISSSATVTPNENEFSLKMYGFVGENIDNIYNMDEFSNETSSNIYKVYKDNDELVPINMISTINSSALKLDMGQVELKNPGDGVLTLVKIVNEGNYDAYFYTSQLDNIVYDGECIASDGTSQTLVNDVCSCVARSANLQSVQSFEAYKQYIDGTIDYETYEAIRVQDCFSTIGTNEANNFCKLGKNEAILLTAVVAYSWSEEENEDGVMIDTTPKADGPFTVTFPDLQLEFTTTPPATDGE